MERYVVVGPVPFATRRPWHIDDAATGKAVTYGQYGFATREAAQRRADRMNAAEEEA